jgi:hypothetical protein
MPRPATHLDAAKPSGSPTVVVHITPRVLDKDQAAAYICATPYAVEQYWASGEIKSYLQSGRRVCDVKELDAYVDRRNREPSVKLESRTANLRGAA